MDITKSSRHAKIIGNLGEALVANWLSRLGWETLLVDHVEIDLISFKRQTGKRIGVTVKSRTREHRTEMTSVTIFANRKGDRKKIRDACEDFACEPWLAIYVETKDEADLYLTSLEHYDKNYRGRAGKAVDDWKMTRNRRDQYLADPKVCHLHLKVEPHNLELVI